MHGRNRLEAIFDIGSGPQIISPGRLMTEMALPQNAPESGVLYDVIRNHGRQPALEMLDRVGLRGRGGGGFPTAHKWWLVSSADADEKFFICNANFSSAPVAKESWFVRTHPGKVIEATALGAYCTGARTAFIALPESASEEIAALESAIWNAHQAGTLGENIFNSHWGLDLKLIKTPDAYITGEETALLNFMEGKPLQPRGKPPLPTDCGLFSKPTAINNLETILQARYAFSVGPEVYRSVGTPHAPGTMVFTVLGRVRHPGIYELPLGARLREVIAQAGGMATGTIFKAAFPGGPGSAVFPEKLLDMRMDFDSVRDAGSDIGSGTIIVLGQEDCMVEIATRLAAFFNDASCGKCKPCKDGTARTLTMLTKLQELDRLGIDIPGNSLPASPRHPQLTIINNVTSPGGVSYTDTVKGLDKISHLCQFFKYRGDCHHSTEAATSLTSLLSAFRQEFHDHMITGKCTLSTSSERQKTTAEVG